MIYLFIVNSFYRWQEWRKARPDVFVTVSQLNRENR